MPGISEEVVNRLPYSARFIQLPTYIKQLRPQKTENLCVFEIVLFNNFQ